PGRPIEPPADRVVDDCAHPGRESKRARLFDRKGSIGLAKVEFLHRRVTHALHLEESELASVHHDHVGCLTRRWALTGALDTLVVAGVGEDTGVVEVTIITGRVVRCHGAGARSCARVAGSSDVTCIRYGTDQWRTCADPAARTALVVRASIAVIARR